MIKFHKWRSNYFEGGWIVGEWRWSLIWVRWSRNPTNATISQNWMLETFAVKILMFVMISTFELTILPWLDPLPSSCCFQRLPTMLFRFFPTRSPPPKFFPTRSPPPSFPTSSCIFASRPKAPSGPWGNVKYYLLEAGWSWEGLSLLIRGTIGAISGSNSKVEGGQLNPRMMGGSSSGPATKLFADLAKHSPPWSPR